jgi:hypothetical protein
LNQKEPQRVGDSSAPRQSPVLAPTHSDAARTGAKASQPSTKRSSGVGVLTRKSPGKAAKVVPTPEQIALRARTIWQANGCKPGRDRENWLEAEAQLKAEMGIS